MAVVPEAIRTMHRSWALNAGRRQLFTGGLPGAHRLERIHLRLWEGVAMNFEGKTGGNVHGSELKRGQVVRVRAGDEDLGIGIVDELAAGGVDAVWIFFFGTGPRLLPLGNEATEFTVLESETRFGS